MQTFLPYSDFLKSAKSLDKKRCWKQVVEAKQIISVLEGKTTSWQNHPAVKMWVGHTDLLKHYYNVFLQYCLILHKVNTKMEFYDIDINYSLDIFENNILYTKGLVFSLPWWLGNKDFHRAMRARLIEKDRDFYLPKFPDDEGFNDGKYFGQ